MPTNSFSHECILRVVLAFVFALAAAACTGNRGRDPTGKAAREVAVWLTTADQKALLAPQPSLEMADRGTGPNAIAIDPAAKFQSIVGFGAAITDASVHLLQAEMSAKARAALLEDLFGPAPNSNFSFIRIVFGASDFSLNHYSYDDMPAGERDPMLAHFSIASAKRELLPTLHEALAINPEVTLMASPWSAPAWMKTTDSLITGTLREDAYAPFATYLRRAIEDFAVEGVPIEYISVQNEPDFEPANYPGMRLSPGQRARLIGEFLGPELKGAGLNTKILEWDHNWDKPQQPLSVLADDKAASYISGVAWHCYGGDVAAQSQVRAAYPDKDVFFTECSGGRWSDPWPDAFLWTMRNIIIGAAENWSRGAIMWNLALDESDGPHLGGCGNCRGVVTINRKTGAVEKNPEYYALGHASRFVRRGARRIEGRCAARHIACVAFLNPDGARVLIVVNDGKDAVAFSAQEGRASFQYSLPAASAATFVWR